MLYNTHVAHRVRRRCAYPSSAAQLKFHPDIVYTKRNTIMIASHHYTTCYRERKKKKK